MLQGYVSVSSMVYHSGMYITLHGEKAALEATGMCHPRYQALLHGLKAPRRAMRIGIHIEYNP